LVCSDDEEPDEALARKLQQEEEAEQRGRQVQQQQLEGPDLALARKLQQEELRIHQPGQQHAHQSRDMFDAALALRLHQEEVQAQAAEQHQSESVAPGSKHRREMKLNLRHTYHLYQNRLDYSITKGPQGAAGGVPNNVRARARTLSYDDLHSGPVQRAFFTFFCGSPKFILERLPAGTPLTLAMGRHEAIPGTGAVRTDLIPGTRVVLTPVPAGKGKGASHGGKGKGAGKGGGAGGKVSANASKGRSGMMHAKLHLLQYPDCLRIIISSANDTPADWYAVGQILWAADFPKRKHSCSSGSTRNDGSGGTNRVGGGGGGGGGSSSTSALPSFAEGLADFVSKLCADAPEEARPWVRALLEDHDVDALVDGSKLSLVASVPGKYTDEERFHYGMSRMERLLREPAIRASFQAREPIEFQFSSFSSCEWYFLSPLLKALSGSEPKWDKRPAEMKLIWPSKRRCARDRPEGEGYLNFTVTNWLKVGKGKGRGDEGRGSSGDKVYGTCRGCAPGCTQKHSGHNAGYHHKCMIFEHEPGQEERRGTLCHSKVMIRESVGTSASSGLGEQLGSRGNDNGSVGAVDCKQPRDEKPKEKNTNGKKAAARGWGKGHGWVYAGSANLSVSAWGGTSSTQANGPSISLKHFELGVLLKVSSFQVQ
jgi:hypothetical protein